MLRRLLRAFGKTTPAPAAPAAAPVEDPRVAETLAEFRRMKAGYAALAQPAAAPDATLALLMQFAHACYVMERDDECERALQRALVLEPDSAEAHYAYALLLYSQARLAEAEAQLRPALARAPGDRNVRFTLAMVLLGRNQYPEGYELFRSRLDGPSRSAPHIVALPVWQGEPLQGKTLLLWGDWGGFGDDLAYVRYARAIRESRTPARIIVAVPRPLVRLYAAQPYIDEAVDLATPVTADYRCALIDAGNAFGATYETLPTWPAYLAAPQNEARYWRGQLQAEQRLKVGLVWTSTSVPPVEFDWVGRFDKHIPNSLLARLGGVPGVVFYSLQKGEGVPPAADLLPGEAVVDVTEDLNDFADTAALIEQLDLVIAIDTGVGHLAGALGVPTLLLVKRSRGYFWPEGREDTPWYPSVRMIVQPAMRDWVSVMDRARDVLARRASGVPWPRCFEAA